MALHCAGREKIMRNGSSARQEETAAAAARAKEAF